MLTVIASMEHELAGLRRGLQSIHAINALGTELHVVGVGPVRSRSSVQKILGCPAGEGSFWRDADHALLLLGFAGAVDPGLRTGDLVLASRYYLTTDNGNPPNPPLQKGSSEGSLAEMFTEPSKEIDGYLTVDRGMGSREGDFLTPDPTMWQLAREAAEESGRPLTLVDSLTVDGLAGAATKASLGRQFAAGSVNMEDYWLAALARNAGVPFLSIRVILDPASQSLPGYLMRLSQSSPLTALRAAAMPWRIPALLRLGRQMRLAQAALTQFGLSFSQRFNQGNSEAALPVTASAFRYRENE